MYKRRRVVGTALGAALATALLPGISLVLDSPPLELLLPVAVFLIVNQLIHTYPGTVRSAAPIALLALGALGVLQDTLIWLLVSWLGSRMDYGVHVDGFLAALLGGVIVRATVLVCLALGPQPVPEAS
ncbi:phage holin family protein [Streptomyces sp. NBC_01352]|uniref:Integral membrane protein n=1 Tax=Streptomyces plumbiresistens TaxID=511811 RepID=A0ABP7S5G9_9ACTN|nr:MULTISPECIES: phage holin family protein [unclassified Streptomyces]MCX4698595.1 phage holin family protein [Streptomyces sp. NBC_01373]